LGAPFRLQSALERGELEAAGRHYRVLRDSGFVPQLDGRAILTKAETLVRIADAAPSWATLQTPSCCIGRSCHARTQDGALTCWGVSAR
jgi:hypothetical protein